MAPSLELCRACGEPYTEHGMVQCDGCEEWTHFKCAGVDDSVADRPWTCAVCSLKKPSESEEESEVEEVPKENMSMKDLLVMIRKQHAREETLQKRFSSMAKEISTLKLELAESKKPSDLTAESAKSPSDSPQPELGDMMKEVLRKEKSLATSFAAIDPPGEAVSSSRASELSELAALMKLSHVADLPPFSGSCKSWPYFLSVFKRTTAIASIDNETNVGRLDKALSGEARELVEDQLTYGLDPKGIIAVLERRYGNKEMLLKSLSADLINFPRIQSLKDPNLRRFAVATRTYVAQLKTLDLKDELNSGLLVSFLHEKLSNLPSMFQKWARKQREPSDKVVEAFADFVMEQWEFLPPALTFADEARVTGIKEKPATKGVNLHSSGSVNAEISCLKCGKSHATPACFGFHALNIGDRWNFIRKNGACFLCLSSKDHRASACPSGSRCDVSGCGRLHHPLLHLQMEGRNASAPSFEPQRSVQPATEPSPPRLHNVNSRDHNHDVAVTYAKVVAVRIHGADGSFVDDFAFLDDGSSLTMMDRSIADRLNLQGKPENLKLQWTKGITRTESSLRCDVSISGSDRKARFNLRDVFCVENLDLSAVSQDGEVLAKRYTHLRGLPLPTFSNVKPGLLIGLEHASLLGGSRVIEGKSNEPLAAKSKLGWLVYGPHFIRQILVHSGSGLKQGFQQSHTRLMPCGDAADRELHDLVGGYFAVEAIGIAAKTLRSANDERSLEIMRRTTRFEENRYSTGLLWRSDNLKLPDNWDMAVRRLISEEKKLSKRPEDLLWMNEHVSAAVRKSYARILSDEELQVKWERVWNCPLFTVINQNKIPPKRRCVSDVAATKDGVSLNNSLLTGPDILIALPAALCRARENVVMVTADVAEMFHQVRIIPEDQQCQRFLWRDGDSSKKPRVYVMQAMMFGPTCSPFQAQYVKNLHADKFREQFPKAAEALIRFMYMDDYFNSHETVGEAVEVTTNAITICSDMSFDLTQVQSNSQEFLSLMPPQKVKKELLDVSHDAAAPYASKLLGMFWEPGEDVFVFRRTFDDLFTKMSETDYRPTKREVLSCLMKFFDPLGLIAKYIVRGKWLLQDVWRSNVGWDEKLPKSLAKNWILFLGAFNEIESLKIPRWYGGRNLQAAEAELVVFVDASDKSYAAVAYFRFPQESPIQVSLVMGKTKVAPVKTMSIPRLELEAAKIGARLANTILSLHSFPVKRRFFLSDSKCVLSWIHSESFSFPPFVAHRVSEILTLTTPQEWFYVPSAENVADDATKDSVPSDSPKAARWFQGPDFLRCSVEVWPIEEFRAVSVEGFIKVHRASPASDPEEAFIARISARCRSKWARLIGVVATTIKASRFFKRKLASIPDPSRADDLAKAEFAVFRLIQREVFSETWDFLELSSRAAPAEATLKQGVESSPLPVIMYPEDKLIRLRSRERGNSMSFSSSQRILLPKNHELVRVFIQHLHEANHHMGIEGTIAEARETVWIVAIRQVLRKVIASCQFCKNRLAKPSMPPFASLHPSRTAFDQKPFSHVGADCFGPILVKAGRSEVKRWGVIFTCLTFRAAHLEIVLDLSADQMLLAIRRLVARRGQIVSMYSDNGTNFVGSKRISRDETLSAQRHLGEESARLLRLEWKFIPAFSPWMGGSWERLIGFVKRCLKFCLAGEIPTEHVLQNAFVEAEVIVNKRPLTHTPISPDDAEPLTPNLALFGNNDLNQAKCPYEDRNRFARLARKRVAHLTEKFKKRWESEYLPVIARMESSPPKHRNVVVGDVVLVAEGEQHRERWQLGRIVKVHPSGDGIGRIVDVKMGSGEVRHNRAVGNMAVLDVSESSSH
jgi:hypothetical protein